MTRINLVPVSELYDQHLLAEYRELPRVASALLKSINSKNGLKTSDIPSKFCLGKGHVKFFYNKGEFLCKRYLAIVAELHNRGIKTKYLGVQTIFYPFPNAGFYLDWTPTKVDIALSRKRIAELVALKPQWYKKTDYKDKTK